MPLSSTSRLAQYRLALLPVIQDIDTATCHTVLVEADVGFLNLVVDQDLGAVWHHRLQSGGLLKLLSPDMADALRAARMAAAAGYLPQRQELQRIDQLFVAHGIPYLVVKGAYLRECIYPDPTLRPANDIDILVLPQDRQRAVQALLSLGFTYHEKADSISHEALFILGKVDIDLHWHLMRPGRTRIDMTQGFLSRRQKANGFYGLSDSDAFFLMLTHPAFTRYVCSPDMGLGRVADFLLWIQEKNVAWPEVLQLLDMAGVKTAAWATLSWFRMLAQPELVPRINEWRNTLQPGRLRASYLDFWLAHDLPTRWFHYPFLIKFGYTLFLHDHLSDAVHALHGLWQAWRNRALNQRLLMQG